jgi:hypothetical protein
MFNKLETYKPDIDKTFRMLDKLYFDALNKKVGNVTFRALPPSDVEIYTIFDLTKYNYESDIDQYVTDLLNLLNQTYMKRKDIDDNMVPTISPILGIGDYSAFVSGEIIFKSDTSWSTPCLKDINDYKKLPPLGTSKWYQKFLYICEAMLKRSENNDIPFMRGFFSPLDLAASLRGEDIYYDFYDNPEELHGLLDYCAEATIRFAEDIYSLARKYLGNSKYGMFYCSNMINMSEDIACMISGDLYREFCAPHTQKVIDHFGSGHMHCHSRAMYLVKEICSLKNVANLWLASDPNQPRPIDNIESLIKDANGTCLAIDCQDFSEIRRNVEQFKKGNFSICLPTKDVKEAISLTSEFNRLFK